MLDALTNLRGWNDDMRTSAGRRAWGKRACTYFAYDPASRQFAPSKFCAYTPVHPASALTEATSQWHRMSVAAYTSLNDGTHAMDGQRAWRHLTQALGMRAMAADNAGLVADHFAAWLAEHHEALRAGDWRSSRSRSADSERRSSVGVAADMVALVVPAGRHWQGQIPYPEGGT